MSRRHERTSLVLTLQFRFFFIINYEQSLLQIFFYKFPNKVLQLNSVFVRNCRDGIPMMIVWIWSYKSFIKGKEMEMRKRYTMILKMHRVITEHQSFLSIYEMLQYNMIWIDIIQWNEYFTIFYHIITYDKKYELSCVALHSLYVSTVTESVSSRNQSLSSVMDLDNIATFNLVAYWRRTEYVGPNSVFVTRRPRWPLVWRTDRQI